MRKQVKAVEDSRTQLETVEYDCFPCLPLYSIVSCRFPRQLKINLRHNVGEWNAFFNQDVADFNHHQRFAADAKAQMVLTVMFF
ncbi:MAG TPA: hypothetical protein VKA27_05770 [Sunxiuqinia sp.]|nr:hypothetical protein [Sunxiuqinia sp.]